MKSLRHLLPVLIASAMALAGAEELDFTPGEIEVRNRLSADLYEVTTIRLWPGAREDDTRPFPDESLQEGRIVMVTKPSMMVARPKDATGPTPAVFICPGGGYGSLGITSGGVDIVDWLRPLGVTGIYLKYRVPKRNQGFPMHYHPLQDIQRAVSLLRSRAEELNIDPDRIGAIGFSAGGNLCAMLATNHLAEDRLYEPVDEADQLSCRPDFVAMVAPAYLTDPIESDQLRPELQLDKVARNVTPPVFIASAVTDKFTIGSLHFALALREKRVPVEVHIYEQGGHAEGIHNGPHNQWPEMFGDWMRRKEIVGE